MGYQTLTFEKTENIAVVNVRGLKGHPENTLRLSDEIAELCAEITWDNDVRVIVLTGIGEKSVSFESDLGTSFREEEGVQTRFCPVAEPIAKIDRPVIAAVQGDAIDQSLEMALACDIRVAAETSRFGLTQIGAGVIPWDGGTQRLARLVGRGKSLELILTGEIIDAQEAYRIGLVTKVVPAAELLPTTMALAREMASKSPIALRHTKEAVYKGLDMTLEQGLRLEADLYLLIHTTRDRVEGIRAFQEKRVPKFEGK